MLHLRKAKNGEFYMNAVARNGKETWRTSETYKRRRGAIRAAESLAKGFGWRWAVTFTDHTR